MRYRMEDYLRATRDRIDRPASKFWEIGRILDQGSEGACVGFAWAAWENARPQGYMRQQGNDFGFAWYEEAKRNDPWPGTDYDGTATGAGAKVGLIRGYLKAWLRAATVDEVLSFIGNESTVVMGTNWRRSMDRVYAGGVIKVDLSTSVRGGHAWHAFGYDDTWVYAQNSWGEGYAEGGVFKVSHLDFRKLLYDNGEALAAVQTGVPPR
jgi:hypothetical protein